MHDIWNPWHGCVKVSPGCKNCYMMCLDNRRDITDSTTVRKIKSNFELPLKKNRQKEFKIKAGERLRVNMTSDTFIDQADDMRDDMWAIIRARPDVIFWLLTKRPERIADHLPADWDNGNNYENVSLNITCENQDMFNILWPIFEKILAKHKGICIAPILGPIDITPALASGQIEEIHIGGENYDNPRMCDYEWIEDLSRQCHQYKINMHWYESGTVIKAGDKINTISIKQNQARVAGASRLNCFYGKPHYILKDPDDHHILQSDELYVPVYNSRDCFMCGNQNACNGCDPKCMYRKETDQTLTYDQLVSLQKMTVHKN